MEVMFCGSDGFVVGFWGVWKGYGDVVEFENMVDECVGWKTSGGVESVGRERDVVMG